MSVRLRVSARACLCVHPAPHRVPHVSISSTLAISATFSFSPPFRCLSLFPVFTISLSFSSAPVLALSRSLSLAPLKKKSLRVSLGEDAGGVRTTNANDDTRTTV